MTATFTNEMIAGLAQALTFEIELSARSCGWLDARIGAPEGTCYAAISTSELWEIHPAWGGTTHKPVSGAYDEAGAQQAGDLARSFPSTEIPAWSAASAAWIRERALRFATAGELPGSERATLEALDAGAATAGQITQAAGLTRDAAWGAINRLLRKGLARRIARGTYASCATAAQAA